MNDYCDRCKHPNPARKHGPVRRLADGSPHFRIEYPWQSAAIGLGLVCPAREHLKAICATFTRASIFVVLCPACQLRVRNELGPQHSADLGPYWDRPERLMSGVADEPRDWPEPRRRPRKPPDELLRIRDRS